MNTQFDTTKLYAAKSSVTRALKALLIDPAEMEIKEKDGKFYAVPKKVSKAKGEGKPRNGNCLTVWETADSMAGARRKDVVAACVAKGIPEGTAKTQYQQWFASRK